MADLNNEVIKLTEENSKLNKEIEQLRIRVASGRHKALNNTALIM